MDIAALITWIITALGGFVLLSTWIRSGGHRQPSSSRFPPALTFGLAAGLTGWIIYVVNDSDALAWTAFVLLVPVAVVAGHGALAVITVVLVLLTPPRCGVS